MTYCSLDQVRAELGFEVTETSDDALILEKIDQAQADIDSETHRTFEAPNDTTKTFDSVADVDGRTLIFDVDIAQITTVTNGDASAAAAAVRAGTGARSRTDSPIDGAFMCENYPCAKLPYRAGAVSRIS